jgi:hypothetical protein
MLSNRFDAFENSTGEKLLDSVDRLEIDIYRRKNGSFVASAELHLTFGDVCGESETSPAATPDDLQLLSDLLARFQKQKGGAEC